MTITFTIPWPPSVNSYWRHHAGRTLISRSGRAYLDAVRVAVQAQALRHAYDKPVAVEIEAHMPDRRRRDLDNALKAPLDALTHAGLWIDDSQIDDLRIVRHPVTTGGELRVTVREL